MTPCRTGSAVEHDGHRHGMSIMKALHGFARYCLGGCPRPARIYLESKHRPRYVVKQIIRHGEPDE